MAITAGIVSINSLYIFAHPFTEKTLSLTQALLLLTIFFVMVAFAKKQTGPVLAFFCSGISIYSLSILTGAITGNELAYWISSFILGLTVSIYAVRTYSPYSFCYRMLYVFCIGAMTGGIVFSAPYGGIIVFLSYAFIMLVCFVLEPWYRRLIYGIRSLIKKIFT